MRYRTAIASLSSAILAACVSVTLVPGADKVRVTNNAQDVTACTAVGNVRVPRDSQGNPAVANPTDDMRNQTIGLGGNTVFITSAILGEGVAYRCP
jgi:hypothetical protein